MIWLSRLASLGRNWLRKDRADRQLDDEVRGYAELLADEKIDRGVPANEAQRQAFAEMGGIEPVKEAVRDVRAGALLEALWRDVRFAGRLLRKSPGFTLAAVASLGLGIGFNTSIFAILDAVLLRPLPVAEPSRLADIYTSGSDGDTFATNSVPDLQDFRAESRLFEDVAGYSPMFAAVGGGERARLTFGEIVTGNYFPMLGVPALLGRTLLPQDDIVGAPATVVLSERYWRREFGGDPAVLGRPLRLRGEPHTIVGVIDDTFAGMLPMLAPDLWVPVVRHGDVEPAGINETVPSPLGTSRLDRRGSRWLFLKARLAKGVSAEQVHAGAQVVGARLAAEYPETNRNRRLSVRASSATRLHPEADGPLSWIASGTMVAVGLVLLIACANVAGMLLARGAARAREVSVRLALGAGRLQLLQQLFVESLVLAGLGAAAGLALAWWLMGLISRIDVLALPVPLSLSLRIDGRALAFTLAASMLTAVLAGLVPALKATRPDLVSALRGEARSRAMGRRWTLRDGLVILQMAVTTVLLVVAGLLVRSLTAAAHADVGFQPTGVAMISLDTSMLRYSGERSQQFFDEALRRVQALPGVQSAALATRLPFSLNYNQMSVAVPGRQSSPDETGPAVQASQVSTDYFETLGIPLVQGRLFAGSDTRDTPPVAIINQAMARRFWPDGQGSPIGQRVFERMLSSGRSYEIIGVIADHKLRTVGEPPMPAIYLSFAQRPSGFVNIIVRRRGDEQALLADMRRTLLALEPNALIIESRSLPDHVSAMLLPARIGAALVGAFGTLGLLLAAVGLYGVIAFSVARRTREIGIRIAIGARPGSVLREIMRQGLTLAVAGFVVGGVLSVMVAQILAGVLYGVSAADPFVWGGAAFVLLSVAALANLMPAWRAMQIDPTRALRME